MHSHSIIDLNSDVCLRSSSQSDFLDVLIILIVRLDFQDVYIILDVRVHVIQAFTECLVDSFLDGQVDTLVNQLLQLFTARQTMTTRITTGSTEDILAADGSAKRVHITNVR